MKHPLDRTNIDNAWCPGCGNFGILKLLEEVLTELECDPKHTVIVSGIGQAAKTPYYIDTHMFCGLHGRALPVATALKASNPALNVIAEGGDGDMYGEGGNHFMHTIRRNPDIVHIVHNNMVYGLTKGQASPTTQIGFKTPIQVNGVTNEPFNPISVALALKAGFVSRVNIGNQAHAKKVLKEAFLHKGYALVDVFQPCVVFNKVNTYKWFNENTYELDSSYESNNLPSAMQKALENDPIPIGIFYQNRQPTFEEHIRGDEQNPLVTLTHDIIKLQELFDSY
ncbi:thiamine pyrophosphate-dependent enzyme [Sulfurovum sp. XTW-4]|uniref:Thiamine pyrophosphate-dependent enzyme n=1 Tax=Sulfurovum xiamenensis TaxID=3019066 RepID=A0ABT7QQK1_9BACT|nr:thiamine pyrophosphate-dependent enzyme [Sulfurovum xiamenensis]MDM5263364.1 thiamine pyrophosphate-dependent enzyme [Sulfurovum xiamenensis]